MSDLDRILARLGETYPDATITLGDDPQVLTVARDDEFGRYEIRGHRDWRAANDHLNAQPDITIPYCYVDVSSGDLYGAIITVEPDTAAAENLLG